MALKNNNKKLRLNYVEEIIEFGNCVVQKQVTHCARRAMLFGKENRSRMPNEVVNLDTD